MLKVASWISQDHSRFQNSIHGATSRNFSMKSSF